MYVYLAQDDSDALNPYSKPIGALVYDSLEAAQKACEHEHRHMRNLPEWKMSILDTQWRLGYTSAYVERVEVGTLHTPSETVYEINLD
jgi:hypothetical protein